LSALAITNQTEIHYRNSKNQRLQVELALLKLCHIPSVFRFPEPSLLDEELKKKRVAEVVSPLPLNSGIESSLSPEPSILKPIMTPKTNTQPISGAEIRFKIPKKEDIQLSQQKALEEGIFSSQSFKRMKPVTGEALIKAWREYIKEVERKEDHGIYAVLNPISPEIEDDFVIRLKLQNSVHKNLVQEESDNILGFLRNELENDLLHFELSVSFSETKDLAPFTSQDKLKYLIEINPVLEKLKDTLGLEIDY
jgi:DNA polymerase III subunit gamma/tau